MSTSLVPGSTSLASRSSKKIAQTLSKSSNPSTLVKQNPTLETSSPGIWKHPQIQEIAKRQRKATFDGDNVRTILWNCLAFITAMLLRGSLSSMPSVRDHILTPIYAISGNIPLHVFHVVLAFNVCQALLPLFRGKDNLADIDLTASQRSLLGLDPDETPPATPTTKYSTPPRYARSSTPRNGTPGSRGNSPAGSPSSYKASPAMRQASASPSPQVTPLLQRAIGNSEPRRDSYGFSSASGTPLKDSSMFVPHTPSPVGKSSGIPMSSKWIYHKGRSMSGSRNVF